MSNYDKKKALGVIALAGAVGVGTAAVAVPGQIQADEPKRKDYLNSKGNIEIDKDGDGTSDIKFSSDDLKYIADEIDNLESLTTTKLNDIEDDVKDGKIGLLSTIGSLNDNETIQNKVEELSTIPDAVYPTWDEVSALIEQEAEIKRSEGYAEGVNDTLVANSVKIGYHQHTTACQCGNAGVRQDGNSGDWRYLGDGWWTWSVTYYCTKCNANRGWSGEVIVNGFSTGWTNTMTPTCTAITCGRTPNKSIDDITINGVKYDVLNGVITQQ